MVRVGLQRVFICIFMYVYIYTYIYIYIYMSVLITSWDLSANYEEVCLV